ncbi:DNA recombination protein RmuC [Maritalea mediterranea]|uniref:DNA recombination protein RmuC homolog n=1 Tax=Maritalea mediterranea TaxID=2909667 RepID=A0ABS9E3Q4_9HYPH|nr:DNA recombination protein RmuC [Maritalea mediterranea]MCF4097491.1 DNA recombination protein RmuC [Maritalea mediterranea]
MNDVLFNAFGHDFTALELILAGVGLLLVLAVAALVGSWRASQKRAVEAARIAERNQEMERHLADLMRVQSEMTGRMHTMSEIFGSRTSDLAKALTDRIDSASHRMGQTVNESRTKTEESLSKLNERLAVIDRAQANISELSNEMVSLRDILANKQSRGAFGQGRMEAIISDGLPSSSFQFQATLSNNSRPDCLVLMPNKAPDLVVDAKFPLESWQRINDAQDAVELKGAMTQFRTDMTKHIKDISEKYLIAGETQDTAFMFVPSEAIFADIHEKFDDLVQKALRMRVVIVSPSLLMLSIQVIQALLRDVKMREQAHIIQQEVTNLLADVGRLSDRVHKLQNHFQQANRDVEQILISTGKVTKRGERIEQLEFEEPKGMIEGDG